MYAVPYTVGSDTRWWVRVVSKRRRVKAAAAAGHMTVRWRVTSEGTVCVLPVRRARSPIPRFLDWSTFTTREALECVWYTVDRALARNTTGFVHVAGGASVSVHTTRVCSLDFMLFSEASKHVLLSPEVVNGAARNTVEFQAEWK